MFTQLNPPIPVYVVSKNCTGLAHAVIDYSPEFNLLWVVFLDTNGECWQIPNPDIRAKWNRSMERIPRILEDE